jgi:hypothetical protein
MTCWLSERLERKMNAGALSAGDFVVDRVQEGIGKRTKIAGGAERKEHVVQSVEGAV